MSSVFRLGSYGETQLIIPETDSEMNVKFNLNELTSYDKSSNANFQIRTINGALYRIVMNTNNTTYDKLRIKTVFDSKTGKKYKWGYHFKTEVMSKVSSNIVLSGQFRDKFPQLVNVAYFVGDGNDIAFSCGAEIGHNILVQCSINEEDVEQYKPFPKLISSNDEEWLAKAKKELGIE